MRGLLQRLIGPRPAPPPNRNSQMVVGAFHAMSAIHALGREYLDGDTCADPAMILCEVERISAEALLEMYSLARLGP
jgi:hypothetical protein